MATVRVYTSIDQSCKLAEILPIESTDGFRSIIISECQCGRDWDAYNNTNEDY